MRSSAPDRIAQRTLDIGSWIRCMGLVGLVVPAVAQAQTPYRMIKCLTGLGSNPTALIEGTDHSLYGTLNDGGSKWEGAVFKINKDGGGYIVLHDFSGYRSGEDGSWRRVGPGAREGRGALRNDQDIQHK